MIDLHCHLLPGVDDGPGTLDESLTLCRIAVADGITHAVVTPHIHPGRWDNTLDSIQQDCTTLQTQLARKNIPLQLGFAAEVRLTDQIMLLVESDAIPFYGQVDGYKVMLLEFPHGHIIPGTDKLVHWLMENKIRPLIAHPERNKQVMKDVGQLLPFIEMGCWLQVTAGSITGAFGERARRIARQLLEDDAVAVIASDGHNGLARQPGLKQAFSSVARDYGKEKALILTQHNPQRIVADQFTYEAMAV